MLSKKYCWFMFFVSTLFFFYEFILRVSPGIMANELRNSFHINAQGLGLMSSAFFQAYAWMQIPVGVLYDRFSPRKILTLSCLLCAIGALLFASTHSFWLAVAGRCIIGIGAAFGFVGTLKIAEQWLPIKHFSFISGFLCTLGFLGAVISDNLLSAILKFESWSTSLLYLGGVGIILSIFMYLIIYDSPTLAQKQKQLSFKDLVQGLKNILRNPYIWINGAIGFLIYFPTSAFAELWGKSYLETVLHFNTQQAVFAVTAIFIGWAAGGPLMGWLSDRSGNRKLFLGLGAFGAALCISVVLFIPFFDHFTIAILLFLFGVLSGAEILNFVYAMELSTKEFSATAIAVTNMMVVLGGAFSQSIIGWFLDLNWNHGLSSTGIRLYSANDFQHVFTILPITLLIGGILSLFLKNNQRFPLPDGASIKRKQASAISGNC